MISTASIPLLAHIVVAGAFMLRVLYRKLEVNTALAWMVVLITMPFGGPVLYVLFGEHSLGRRRVKQGQGIREFYRDAYAGARVARPAASAIPEPFGALSVAIAAGSGFPVLSANTCILLTEAGETLERMRQDIDAARHACRLEFYILEPGGRVDAVLEAVRQAAARGVSCQILADAYGSKRFFRSGWPARLRAAGVSVVESLPGGLFTLVSKRVDLRNHRKLLICDRAVAYTGSFNLVDPGLFKADKNVGQWVDAMMRIQGEMVDALTCLFAADYIFEGARLDIDQALGSGSSPPRPGEGDSTRMQLLPSGPEMEQSTIYQVIVTAIFNARRRVRLVTPYFIPDAAMLLALTSAAKRGVAVEIIVPRRLDTRIGQYASQSCYDELLAAGVKIRRFEDGLLHAKAALIDEGIAIFGTANMDPRSFHLNLELSLIIYESHINASLDTVLDGYASRAPSLELAAWSARPPVQRLLENLMRLAAPLL